MQRALWVAGAFLLGSLALRGAAMLRQVNAEDFVYYYAGTRAYWAGESPYDRALYQARLRPLLGGENRLPSKEHAWLYPPAMAWLGGPFAALTRDPLSAYRAWSAALGLAALVLLALLARGEGPERLLLPALVLAAPAADNAFWTHRVLWLALPAFVGGAALVARGREKSGGAALALLGVLPQWWLVAAACLAAGRKWRALALAAGLNVPVYAAHLAGLRPLSELRDYAAGLAAVGGGEVFSGNLSLAAALYRLGLAAAGREWAGVLQPGPAYAVLRWAVLAAFALGAWRLWRSRLGWEDKTSLTAAFAVWVQPYSHGSDGLWLMPGVLAALRLAFPERLPQAALAALAGTTALRVLLDFPGGHGFAASAYLAALAAAGAWRLRRPA